MPKFSVILPCYNAAATLPNTIATLQAQTLTDWEAICVDDGSTDASLATLTALAAKDSRLRIVRQENAGPSRARNYGARLATGDYLAFLDADDLWTETKLASVAATFDAAPEAGAVFGRVAFFNTEGGRDTATSTVRPGPTTLPDFLGENPACTLSNMSVKRRAFLAGGGFDERLSHAEDLEWSLRFLASGGQIFGCEDIHVRYRASENGLSANLKSMHDGWCVAVKSASHHISQHALLEAEAVHLRYLARRALRIGLPPKVALGFALRGVRLAPSAFLGGRHRGFATLAGCLAAPILPAPFRKFAFA